jgi:hypothetical protein
MPKPTASSAAIIRSPGRRTWLGGMTDSPRRSIAFGDIRLEIAATAMRFKCNVTREFLAYGFVV